MATYLRYQHGDFIGHGLLDGSTIQPLDGNIGDFRSADRPTLHLDEVKLLAPTVPSKIIAIGPNYRAAFKDRTPPERPNLWTKPPTCLNDPEGIIEIPPGEPGINHEVELAFVIGKRAKQVRREDAHDYIFGYTCMNDVTKGDFATKGAFVASPYLIWGKIFDGFAPLGPWIVTDIDTGNLALKCRVNGQERQNHSTSDRLFDPDLILEFVSNVMTLLPGDVISTGSPPGMTPLVDGDMIEVEIENIGVLRNYARNRSDRT
jgi:2-keto-4-pentenoate hydratase/2-oxohepta-3-ene-1,7-dioic acid hydratase in catechol pathway